MVTHYPHICSYTLAGTADTYDESSGEWILGTPGISVNTECRAKHSNKGKQVRGQDGTMIDYDYDLSFPPIAEAIPIGTTVNLTGIKGEAFFTGRILIFQLGVLHHKASV